MKSGRLPCAAAQLPNGPAAPGGAGTPAALVAQMRAVKPAEGRGRQAAASRGHTLVSHGAAEAASPRGSSRLLPGFGRVAITSNKCECGLAGRIHAVRVRAAYTCVPVASLPSLVPICAGSDVVVWSPMPW